MPIEQIAATTALDRAKKNSHRIYPSGARGIERLQPFAQPSFTAGFRLAPDARIFATGSCFARKIEKSLRSVGLNVTSSATDALHGQTAPNANQLFNKYTVHSILNELRWALSDTPIDHAASLIPDKDGNYYDLQISAARSVTGSLAAMTSLRCSYNASFANIRQADAVIITLGLVECWFDHDTGLYLNTAPPQSLAALYPDRFSFQVLDYDDILQALHDIHDLLAQACPKPPKLLITVSPVALKTTFRDLDVLVANTYSKAVQRAAVESFVATHDASYFPSYEYVTLTDQKFAWDLDDFRHVRQETVDRIMADVLQAYVGESPQQRLLYTRGHAAAHLADDNAEKACTIIDSYLAQHDADEHLMWLYAQALRRTKQHEACIDICLRLMQMGSIYYRPAGRTAMAMLHQTKQVDRLHATAAQYQIALPNDAAFADRYLAA